MPAPKIPKLPAFVTYGGRYICTYEPHWDKDLTQPRRASTKSVGRLVPAEGREGVMEVIFKEEFERLYPGLERFRVFRHKGGKLDFVLRHKRLKPCFPMAPHGVRGRLLHAGASYALTCIAQETGIGAALEDAVERDESLMLLSIAVFIALNPAAPLSLFEPFAEATALPWDREMDRKALRMLFDDVREDDLEAFSQSLSIINSNVPKAKPGQEGQPPILALIPSCGLAFEGGRAFSHLRLPQEEPLAFLIRSRDGAPLGCLRQGALAGPLLDGLLPDAPRVIVAEGGGDLAAKASSCLGRGFGFVMSASLEGAPGLKAILDGMRPAPADFNRYDPYLGLHAASSQVEIRDGKLERAAPGQGGLWLHLYQSPEAGSDDKMRLISRLSRARRIFNQGGDPGRAGMELLKRFCSIGDGMATIDNRLVDEAAGDSGAMALLSSGIDDPSEAFLAFRQLADLEASLGAFSQRLTCDPFGLPLSGGLCGKALAQADASMLILASNARIDASCENGPSATIRLTLNCQSRSRALGFLGNAMATRCDGGLVFEESSKRDQMLFKALRVRWPRGAETFPF